MFSATSTFPGRWVGIFHDRNIIASPRGIAEHVIPAVYESLKEHGFPLLVRKREASLHVITSIRSK